MQEQFILALEEQCREYLTPQEFSAFLDALHQEFPHGFTESSAASAFLRIIQAIPSRATFIRELTHYPLHLRIVSSIALHSNYLTDIIVRNPEFLYATFQEEYLQQPVSEEELSASLSHRRFAGKSLPFVGTVLRLIKRREMLRIGLKDILGLADLHAIVADLSLLAKVLSATLLDQAVSLAANRHGIATSAFRYSAVSLGKLGGKELNYSSDIDLLVFFDTEEEDMMLPVFELMNDAVQGFIQEATAYTDTGFLYRVDFRLRPDGKNAPLVRTLQEYLFYYETRGEDWERQMLLKSGFLGGDRQLYQSFTSYLTPFIYQSCGPTPVSSQIASLRREVTRKLRDDENIKLSLGGIRDIEFSVQALQLVFGSQNKALRTGSTMEAIRQLRDAKLLHSDEAEVMIESYCFFRKIEHYLQLMNDAQTHSIPTSGEPLNRLASFFGFPDAAAFTKKVDTLKLQIQSISATILSAPEEDESTPFSMIGFTDLKKAKADLEFLREGKGLLRKKEFDGRTIALFHLLEDDLLRYLAKTHNPNRTLHHFARFIHHSAIPFVWYEVFQNPTLFQAFLRLCARSAFSVELMADHEMMKEHLLSGRVFEPVSPDQLIHYSVKEVQFILSAQFALELIRSREMSNLYSAFIRSAIVAEVTAWEKNHALPPYLILGFGSFSTGRMNLHSDVDLVFLVNELTENTPIDAFAELLEALRKKLAPVTFDCRLRPEGDRAPLVTDMQGMERYCSGRMRVWEYQTYAKVSYITGDYGLYRQLLQILRNGFQQCSASDIREQMKLVRKKMLPPETIGKKYFYPKRSQGGLADIDILSFLRAWQSGQLWIENATPLAPQEGDILSEPFELLKQIETAYLLYHNTGTSRLPVSGDAITPLLRFLNADNYDSFRKQFDAALLTVREEFRKHF